eukprot:EG_transcript_8749
MANPRTVPRVRSLAASMHQQAPQKPAGTSSGSMTAGGTTRSGPNLPEGEDSGTRARYLAELEGLRTPVTPEQIDWWARVISSGTEQNATALPVDPTQAAPPKWYQKLRRPVVRWLTRGWLQQLLIGDADLTWEVFEVKHRNLTLQVRVDLTVTNFNSFGVELTRLDTRLHMKGQGNNSAEFWICDGRLKEPVAIEGKKVTTIPLQLKVSYNMFTEAAKSSLLTKVVADCTNQDLASMTPEELDAHAPHFRIEIPRGEVRIAGFLLDLPTFNVTRSIKRPVDLTSVIIKILIHPRTRIFVMAGAVFSFLGLLAWIWVSYYGTPDPFPRLLILWPDQKLQLPNINLPKFPLPLDFPASPKP